jgi:DNA polymerase-3 subunit epsilon
MKTELLAFIDVETTGLDADKHEIIQLACVLAKQTPRVGKGPEVSIIEEFELKIAPTRLQDAEPDALRINGFNEMEWVFAIDLKNAMEHLAKKAKGAIMVAHNLTFDDAFIQKAFKSTGVENTLHFQKLDTLSLAFAQHYNKGDVDKYSLRYLCELYGIKNERAHTALADTKALFEVYKKMMNA